ncbi:MAG: PAS domain-containing protein [Candidatus Methanomethylophilaceae archaeon]|nr:PAS domain-containing protein [Candidatus Methanomethylophilaceae archaeon]
MEKSEIYTEKLMNMILDAVDDIIIIHDSEHTIIWMNRAGERAFGTSVEKVIGQKCFVLFGNTTSCDDCTVGTVNIGGPTNKVRRRIIPKTDIECDCSTIPYYENGRLELVVQHLRPVCACSGKD